MPGLLKIEACVSRWGSLFPSDSSPQNKVPSDSFNVNKAIHISLAAQPRHQQWLDFTNIKHSCRVIAPHFQLSWTVRVALDCLFITNYTFTMATQSHLDWSIQEVERAHNKYSEALLWFSLPSSWFCVPFSLLALRTHAKLNISYPDWERRMSACWVTEDCVNVTFSLKIFNMIWIPSYSLVKRSMEIKVK